MPSLPPELVHLPFEPGPYRMAMGLFTVPERNWFEIDALYPNEMAERRRLLSSLHPQVFAALPQSAPARREALSMIAGALRRHHPDWFSGTDAVLHNHLTSEAWDLEAVAMDPLELAGRLVQEDLCIIQGIEGGPRFSAGVLCFPSRWRMNEKIGKPLADVHGPVPRYADRLARPVDRFMGHVKPGHIAARLNWSILDSPALYQPAGKWRDAADGSITASNAGQALFLRVERQTLRRLPASDAILFGIRVHNYRLEQVIANRTHAAALAEAVRALPREILHYKSMLPFHTALLAWLDAIN